jgi:predicted SnoaL-like aldol condensation-catalyzing enzyme
MSTEANKRVAQRIADEIFNQGNLDAVDVLFAADYVEHSPLPGLPPTRESVKQIMASLRAAFPDLSYTTEAQIAEDDKVVSCMRAYGTHLGMFQGIAPTAKQASWQEIHVARIADGQVVEHWSTVNTLDLLQQISTVAVDTNTAPAYDAEPESLSVLRQIGVISSAS